MLYEVITFPVAARPDTPWYRVERFARRHRLGVATAGVIGLLLAGYAVTVTVQQRRVEAEAAKAKLEESLTRRQALAERRIAQAEAQAEAQVRAQAVDLAVAATRQILAEKLDEAQAARLVDEALKDLPVV